MSKVDKKALIKNIRALNRLKLVDALETKGDVEDLAEDFISAIEEIDDNGKIGKVKDPILDFYESMIPTDNDGDGDGDGDGDIEEKLAEMDLKELRQFCKDNEIKLDGRITTKNKDEKIDEILEALEKTDDGDGDGDTDTDALEEELNDMSLKELRAYVKENGIKIDGRVTAKNKDDVIEACIDAAENGGDSGKSDDDGPDFDAMDDDELLDFCDENDIELTERQEGFTGDKLRKIVVKKWGSASSGKSGKSSSNKDKPELPSGLRANSINAELYLAIADGGAVMSDLAEMAAERKGKEPKQVYGFVQRYLIRNVAKHAEIKATYTKSGKEEDILFELA